MSTSQSPVPDVCVVTGAARGIGRGIAAELIARGYLVVLTDVDGEAVVRTAAELGGAAGLAQDVRYAASHRDVAAAAASHGRLVGWFNNAGVGTDGDLVDLTDEQVSSMIEINLLGVVWGTRAAFAGFGPEGGDVINTASLSGLGPVPGLSLYAATKAAVVSLTMSTSIEAPTGVRVHAVLPDGVATPMVEEMSDGGVGKALVHSGGRLLGVEEVARTAVDLMGSRRVLQTVPVWRGAVARASALVPSLAEHALTRLAAQGRRRMG